jgi:hypothetical protein
MRRGKNGSTIRAGAWLPLISLVLGAAACGARSDLLEPSEGAIGKGSEDAAADGESDAKVDARPDAGNDGGPDAHVPPEAAADAGQDAPIDALSDVVEEPTPDAGPRTPACVAVSPYELYGFELPSGAVAPIGPTLDPLFDIARLPDGTLYGLDPVGTLVTIDVATGNETADVLVQAMGSLNALGAGPDGTLYGADTSGVLYTIDPQTGAAAEVLAYPDGLESSGDVAVLGGVLYASSNPSPNANDTLIAIDLASRSATIVGAIGFQCVWGLAFDGATLYGFTCNGQVITIDTANGAGTMVTSAGASFYGASSL